MGVISLPKTVTRQRRGGHLNLGPSPPESSTLTTRLRSHPCCEYKPNPGSILLPPVNGLDARAGQVCVDPPRIIASTLPARRCTVIPAPHMDRKATAVDGTDRRTSHRYIDLAMGDRTQGQMGSAGPLENGWKIKKRKHAKNSSLLCLLYFESNQGRQV